MPCEPCATGLLSHPLLVLVRNILTQQRQCWANGNKIRVPEHPGALPLIS